MLLFRLEISNFLSWKTLHLQNQNTMITRLTVPTEASGTDVFSCNKLIMSFMEFSDPSSVFFLRII